MHAVAVLGLCTSVLGACGSDDGADLFNPTNGTGGGAGTATGGIGGSATGGTGNPGGAAGSSGFAGGVAGSGGLGGSGGTSATGGQGGTAGSPGPCEYKAHDESSLAALANKVNADVAAGWRVHSFHARSENNSGSARPNVVWLENAGVYSALQDFDLLSLAASVNGQLAAGATIHTVLARPHGSSVPPEVAWLVLQGSVVAHDEWSLGTLQSRVNETVGFGAEVLSFHAREENNSGSAGPNVVWLTGPSGFVGVQDFSLVSLTSTVNGLVAGGHQVHSILARPHGSSVPPEVAWLENAGAYHAFETWGLSELEGFINADTAAGWTVLAIHARSENNSGSAQPNVVWLHQGTVFKAHQDFNLAALASVVTADVATGWRVHTIRARPHGSSVPPEVAWLERCP